MTDIRERRFVQRHACQLPVRIHLPADDWLEVQARDISSVGISLLLPQASLSLLSQRAVPFQSGDVFQLQLPAAGDHQFDAALAPLSCRIRYLRRLSQQQYQLGAVFVDLSADSLELLEALVNGFRL